MSNPLPISDLPLSALPVFDDRVVRNFSDEIELPWDLKDLRFPMNCFVGATEVNERIDRFFDNMGSIVGFSRMWSVETPLSAISEYSTDPVNGFGCRPCDESTIPTIWGDDLQGIECCDDGFIAFNVSAMFVVEDCEIVDVLSCTPSDLFRQIRGVACCDDRTYVLDGSVVHSFATDVTPWAYLGFNGGFGGPGERYRYNGPHDMTCHPDGGFCVADSDNLVVKCYNTTGKHVKTLSFGSRPLSVSNDSDRLYVGLADGRVLVYHNGALETEFNAGVGAVNSLLADPYQEGFIYVSSGNATVKATRTGVIISNVQAGLVAGMCKSGNHLFIASPDSVNEFLDYSYFESILDPLCEVSASSAFHIADEDLVSDKVYNRIFCGMIEQVECMRQAVSGEFITEVDSTGSIVDICTVSAECPPFEALDDSRCIKIAANEPMTWEIANRPIDILHETVQELAECLSPRTSYNQDDGGYPCSWGAMQCDSEPVRINPYVRPTSWLELKPRGAKWHMLGDGCCVKWSEADDLECISCEWSGLMCECKRWEDFTGPPLIAGCLWSEYSCSDRICPLNTRTWSYNARNGLCWDDYLPKC